MKQMSLYKQIILIIVFFMSALAMAGDFSVESLLARRDIVLNTSQISDEALKEVMRAKYESVLRLVNPEFDQKSGSCQSGTSDPCRFYDFSDAYIRSHRTSQIDNLSTVDRYFENASSMRCGFILDECSYAESVSKKKTMSEAERDARTQQCRDFVNGGGRLNPGDSCNNPAKDWTEQRAEVTAAKDYLRACTSRVRACETVAKNATEGCKNPGKTLATNKDYQSCWLASKSTNPKVLLVQKCEKEIKSFLDHPSSDKFSLVLQMKDASKLKTILAYRDQCMRNANPDMYAIAKYNFGISEAREICARKLEHFSTETAESDAADFYRCKDEMKALTGQTVPLPDGFSIEENWYGWGTHLVCNSCNESGVAKSSGMGGGSTTGGGAGTQDN